MNDAASARSAWADAGRRWLGPLRTLSWVVVLGILIQAVLAGQGLFRSPGLFELHGWIGSAVLLISAVVVVLAFLARTPLWLRLASLAVTGGLFVQTGLGYMGRRNGVAIASTVHVPLGVALLGLGVAIAVVASLAASGLLTPRGAVADR